MYSVVRHYALGIALGFLSFYSVPVEPEMIFLIS